MAVTLSSLKLRNVQHGQRFGARLLFAVLVIFTVTRVGFLLFSVDDSHASTSLEFGMTGPFLHIQNIIHADDDNDNDKDNVAKEPLNIIIFYPDDWRHDDLGDERPILQTPFFSRLAKQGIRFTHNAVTTSICWISRATLFTGQWVSQHASSFLSRPLFASEEARWQQTWPYLLQKLGGYWVGHVGKWQYHDQDGYKNRIFNYSKFFEGIFWYGQTHTAKHARNEAITFLKERPKDVPFALTIAFYPPKGCSDPALAVPEYLAKYQNATIPEPYDRNTAFKLLPSFLQDNKTEARSRYKWRFEDVFDYQTTMKTYYAVIEYIDKMCEEVIEEVKRQGIFNKTMIIVSADNGEFHANHALADKWYPFQESIRVPLIIYDPRMPKNKRGTLDDSFTLNVDLAETILGAAGLSPAETMQGRDIADLYLKEPKSKKPWRDEFFYEFPYINHRIPPSRALVRREWKYIEWPNHNAEQLFNLKDDPFEFTDLAQDQQYLPLKTDMKERLAQLRYETMAPNVPETLCDPLPATFNADNKSPCSSMNHSSAKVCCPISTI